MAGAATTTAASFFIYSGASFTTATVDATFASCTPAAKDITLNYPAVDVTSVA